MEWEVFYYRDEKGREPVREYIDKERMKDQVKIFDWIDRLEKEGPNAKRPLVDYLGNEIYELRIKLSDKESRILYFFIFNKAIVLASAWNKKGKAKEKTEYKKFIIQAEKAKKDYSKRFKSIKELP